MGLIFDGLFVNIGADGSFEGAHGYHGSFERNSRGIVNRYLGYWDGNPATLIPLSPEDSAPLYVEMMSGSENIIVRGKQLSKHVGSR